MLNTVLDLHRETQLPILISGHSMGGALGIFSAFDLAQRVARPERSVVRGVVVVGWWWFRVVLVTVDSLVASPSDTAALTIGVVCSVLPLSRSLSTHFDHPRSVMCTTFGSPRIGNKHFERYYNALCIPTWRFTNMNDPVTRLPSFWGLEKCVCRLS